MLAKAKPKPEKENPAVLREANDIFNFLKVSNPRQQRYIIDCLTIAYESGYVDGLRWQRKYL
jgi:hypothetical protein